MIKCTDDSNALENALIDTEDGDTNMSDTIEDDVRALKTRIEEIQYDMDSYWQQIQTNLEDIRRIRTDLKDFIFKEGEDIEFQRAKRIDLELKIGIIIGHLAANHIISQEDVKRLTDL